MSILNRVLGGFVDALLVPFRGFPPLAGLAFLALVASVGILLVFRAKSDQRTLRTTKNRIMGAILEIRLFKDDPRAIFGAQLDVLRHSGTYLRLSLVPMLWVVVPVVLLMIQMESRFGFEGLPIGASTIVKVRLSAPADLVLETDGGLQVETPMLFIPSRREAQWRVSASRQGWHELRIVTDDGDVTKRIYAGEATRAAGKLSPRRPSRSLLDQLLWPSEPPVPAATPVLSIDFKYPEARVSILGLRMHWIVAFFILTIVFAFGLQKPLGVTI